MLKKLKVTCTGLMVNEYNGQWMACEMASSFLFFLCMDRCMSTMPPITTHLWSTEPGIASGKNIDPKNSANLKRILCEISTQNTLDASILHSRRKMNVASAMRS